MIDITTLLDRQAKWQKSLRDLPWPEKIRMAAMVRESVRQLNRHAPSSKTESPGREENSHEGGNTRVV